MCGWLGCWCVQEVAIPAPKVRCGVPASAYVAFRRNGGFPPTTFQCEMRFTGALGKQVVVRRGHWSSHATFRAVCLVHHGPLSPSCCIFHKYIFAPLCVFAQPWIATPTAASLMAAMVSRMCSHWRPLRCRPATSWPRWLCPTSALRGRYVALSAVTCPAGVMCVGFVLGRWAPSIQLCTGVPCVHWLLRCASWLS